MAFQAAHHKSQSSVGLATKYLQNLRRCDFLAGRALVDGHWVTGGERDTVIDPATGEQIADVARCGTTEVGAAIAAADQSSPGWRELLLARRGAILRSCTSLMFEHTEALAILVTSEQGKLLAEVLCGFGRTGANFGSKLVRDRARSGDSRERTDISLHAAKRQHDRSLEWAILMVMNV